MKDIEPRPDSSEPSEQRFIDKIGWIGFIAILLLWAMYWKWVAPRLSDNQFDPLSALFSGLAFWGVIFAILLQRRELALQRNELMLTRREVRGQKEQLEAQNLTLKQQRFENTFFSLLNLFNNIVGSIELSGAKRLGDPPSVIARGRECFSIFFHEFGNEFGKVQHDHGDWGQRTLCVTAYDQFANSRQPFVGHYFRTLYNIVKFIGTSDVEDKQIYVNILRAQLSSPELSLLFYNCISKFGSEKFKPLVERFGLLENMSFSTLLRQDHRELYHESAFHSRA